MQDRLNARVQASRKYWDSRREAFKKVREGLARDENFWAAAAEIRILTWQQAKLCRRFFHERYDFDVRRWRAKHSLDLSSLPRGRTSQETDEIVRSALAYIYWEGARILTQAAEEVAFELGIDPERMICAAFVSMLSCSDSEMADWDQYYSKLPPALKEDLLFEEAGWAGSQLSFNVNKRLSPALSGWGENRPENFDRELPGAVLVAYAGRDNAQHRGSFITQVARALENLGSESASKPGKLTGLSPDARAKGSEDEGVAEMERKEFLDELERATKLSPQQAEVWHRLRDDMSIEDIAAELGITKNQVYVQKTYAIKKLRRTRENLEL
jgi:RNA polymerase sigma factor (sigma-70 family)